MPNQALLMARAAYAGFFGVPPENVLIRSPFIGGGFGSKAILDGAQILCALAARMMGRPVKLALTRAQMYGPVGHRGETRQRLRLGMETDGRLTAISHHAIAATSSFDDFLEPAANASRMLYASPAIAIAHEAAATTSARPVPCARRAKPRDRRRSRSPSMKPPKPAAWTRSISGSRIMPRSSRSPAGPFRPRRCANAMRKGATSFGWAGRPLAPRQMRDENGFLVGWGMGTAVFHCPISRLRRARRFMATARPCRDGAIDMGQGALTALAQIAADSLGSTSTR